MKANKILNIKNSITSKESIISFDSTIISRVLNMIFIKYPNLIEDFEIDQDEELFLNKIIDFISSYNGNDIVNSYFDFIFEIEHKYTDDFYIYFLHLYSQYSSETSKFNANFKTNIKNLFYLSGIESLFNEEKFRAHFRPAFLGSINDNNEIDQSISRYIDENLPKNVEDDLEKAITIYYLLCKIFRYDPSYIVYRCLVCTNQYDKVTLENNNVVCIQFAIIFNKLLQKYGIDSCLVGNVSTHMYVNFRVGTMMLTADSSRYGEFNEDFNISDITATKYNFLIDGLFLADSFYADINYIRYNNEILNNMINKVYSNFGIELDLRKKFNYLIKKYQDRELYKDIVNKEDIDRRIEIINSLFYKVDGEVEWVQMLTKLVVSIFKDIEDERTEQITLYKYENNRLKLNRLLVVYDEDMKPFYYFFENNKFVNYDVDIIVEKIVNGGWTFKNQVDIDALDIEEDRVLKLMR